MNPCSMQDFLVYLGRRWCMVHGAWCMDWAGIISLLATYLTLGRVLDFNFTLPSLLLTTYYLYLGYHPSIMEVSCLPCSSPYSLIFTLTLLYASSHNNNNYLLYLTLLYLTVIFPFPFPFPFPFLPFPNNY